MYYAAAFKVYGKISRPEGSTAPMSATFYSILEVFFHDREQTFRFEAGLTTQGAFLLYLDGEEEQELAYAAIYHIYCDSGQFAPQMLPSQGVPSR